MGRPYLVFEDCYTINPETGCWEWQHALDRDGYPRYRKKSATRWSLVNLGGEEEGNWWALHACNNRKCVRPGPGHLYAGTPRENQRDSFLAGTDQAKHAARDRQWASMSWEQRAARAAPGAAGVRAWWASKTAEERSAIARERALTRWRTELQTFLPYPNLAASVIALDRLRLNKQALECRQILTAMHRTGGWRNHPAVKMWVDHEPALQLYHDCCVREWLRRGYKTVIEPFAPPLSDVVMPPWLGDPAFHASHRSNLLRKMPEWYEHFGWTEPHDLEYVWPVR